jgi:hypothetical protein
MPKLGEYKELAIMLEKRNVNRPVPAKLSWETSFCKTEKEM